MSLVDGIVALAVVLGFAFIIWSKMIERNPQLPEKMRSLFSPKPKEMAGTKGLELMEGTHQVWPERREIM